MKLLVFAHTPPPFHGQSNMVRLMLEGFGGDQRKTKENTSKPAFGIQCYHVNARVSDSNEDIGSFRVVKLFRLLGHCLDAIWCRFRHGAHCFYYIPAPGKKSAVYRDWVVMILCRPFYGKMIFHWHSAGLLGWLESTTPFVHNLTRRLLRRPRLGLILSEFNREDAVKLETEEVVLLPNGLPDPCPEYEREVLPQRIARAQAREKIRAGQPVAGEPPPDFQVLFLAACTREKGLFDTLEGIVLARQRLPTALPMRLTVVGMIASAAEEAEFQARLKTLPAGLTVTRLGFVDEAAKRAAFRAADVFCFPTFYRNENQPANLIEAMAFGLPVITTRWRSLPAMFPPGGNTWLVEPNQPAEIAAALLETATAIPTARLRAHFLAEYSLEQHLSRLAAALNGVEK